MKTLRSLNKKILSLGSFFYSEQMERIACASLCSSENALEIEGSGQS